jgi:DNA processing protein
LKLQPEIAEDSDRLRYWLGLHRAPGIGSRTFAALLRYFGSPEAIFRAQPSDWSVIGLKQITIDYLQKPHWERIEEDLRWLNGGERFCLTLEDDRYPALLREIADPPPVLFVLGNLEALSIRQIAMVGSRNPSPSGQTIARELAGALVRAGFGIVSGLALGIDAASHRGALDAGGITLAVAGTGLDHVYPRQHRQLAEEIVRHQGALVAEFPPGTLPIASNFPRRNRIISGLSWGTVVVEAALKSGSLITARLALEQGREVFAVPGSVFSPLSKGCHELIKNGAKLVQAVEDVLEEFEMRLFTPSNAFDSKVKPMSEGEEEHLTLLKYIAYDPTSVDTLVAVTGNSPEYLAAMLLLLELQGYIASAPGGCYFRIK